MNAFATVTFVHGGLELRCPEASLSEDRRVAADDCQILQRWAARYFVEADRETYLNDLDKLGQEMYEWLNGPSSFLTRSLKTARGTLVVEFVVGREDCEEEFALALLNAPWEVLASNGEFWALQASLAFCPIRRIGKAATPAPPSANRLGLVFMAAAPRGADSLNYEAEETSILKATHSLRLDLVVEEGGTLELLSACVAREKPEVIQIS